MESAWSERCVRNENLPIRRFRTLETLITVDLVQKGPSSATNSEETGTDLPEVARVNRHGGYLATKEPI